MHEKYKIIHTKVEDTLLNCLLTCLGDISKKTIKNYIKHEMVEVNGNIETNSNKVIDVESEIKVYFRKRTIPNINLKIIYEDKDLIAIDKPTGLLSISNSKEKNITAFRMVSDYLKKNNPKSKLFVIHRLDEQTSGVLVFSKNKELKEKCNPTGIISLNQENIIVL